MQSGISTGNKNSIQKKKKKKFIVVIKRGWSEFLPEPFLVGEITVADAKQ